MNPLLLGLLGGGLPATYSVQGITAISSIEDNGETLNSELVFDTDGGIRIRTETASLTLFYTDMVPGWSSLEPNETDQASWSARVNQVSDDGIQIDGAPINTWLVLSTQRLWAFSSTNGGPDTRTRVINVLISNDGGTTTHDTIQITITHTTNSP